MPTLRWRLMLPYALLIFAGLLAAGWWLGRAVCAGSACRVGYLWGAVLVGIVAGGFAGRAIATGALRPLTELQDMARRAAAGHRTSRLLVPRDDEIGQLAVSVGEAIEALQERNQVLRDENQQLAAALATMGSGVIIVDAEGKVVRMNPAARDLLEVTRDPVDGASLAEVIRYYRLIEAWQECRSTGEQQVTALEVNRGDRTTFWQVNLAPLAEGERRGYVVLIQDLTEIHRLQSVRRDFISNISHELRTPLASLKVLLETVQDSTIDDPAAARRFLQRAEGEVDTMSQMVDELLELSRIESGMVPLRLLPAQVADIILPVIERLQPQAERTGVSLIVDISAGLPAVLVDVERIRRVLTNLMHNAIKFTPSSGSVAVSAYRAEKPGEHASDTGQTESTVVVQVSDTGVGILPADLPRIFERFYKADRARSRGGTGLGLAIARHLVQAHGGEIWVRSKQGKGSTFYFSLPPAGELETPHSG